MTKNIETTSLATASMAILTDKEGDIFLSYQLYSILHTKFKIILFSFQLKVSNPQ